MSNVIIDQYSATYRNGGSTISPFLRVIEDAGFLRVASASELENGIVTRTTFPNELAGVQMLHAQASGGNWSLVASGTITSGAVVYRAAGGTVSASGTSKIGVAKSSAGDGQIVQVYYRDWPDAGEGGGGGGGYYAGAAAANRPTLGEDDAGARYRQTNNGLWYTWTGTAWIVEDLQTTMSELPDPLTDELENNQRIRLTSDGSTWTYTTAGGLLKDDSGVGAASKVTQAITPVVKTVGSVSSPNITSTAHGLVNGDRVLLDTTGVLPTGLNAYTLYYVVNKTTDTVQLSATSGGAAITFSGGSGTHYLKKANYTLSNEPTTPEFARVFIQRTGAVFYGSDLTDANTDYTISGTTLTLRADIVETFTPTFKPKIHIEYAI